MEYLKKCLKNGWFLSGMIGLIGLIVVYVAGQFGYKFDYAPIQNILQTLLALMAGVGIVTSPASPGITEKVENSDNTNV